MKSQDQYLKNSRTFCWGNLQNPNPEKADLLDKFALGSCLDVGCGSGIYTKYLSDTGHQVLGIDNQPLFIKAAKKKYPRIEFQTKSFTSITKKKFDTVILFDILEHVDDHQLLDKTKKIARRLIVSVPRENQSDLTRYSLSHQNHLDNTHLRYYTIPKLRSLLKKHRFRIVYLKESLPISLSGLLTERLSRKSWIRKILLKIILKPFLPEPPIYSTIFAVVES